MRCFLGRVLLVVLCFGLSPTSWAMEEGESGDEGHSHQKVANLKAIFTKKIIRTASKGKIKVHNAPKSEAESETKGVKLRSQPSFSRGERTVRIKSRSEDDIFALRDALSRAHEKISLLATRAFTKLIRDEGFLVATRETSFERDEFLLSIPEPFFRGLYSLIRLAYEEKLALDTVETTQKHELVGHRSIRAHHSFMPLIGEKNDEIDRSFEEIEYTKEKMQPLLTALYDAIIEGANQTPKQALAILFNFLSLHALAPAPNVEGATLKGKYVRSNEREQEIHRRLKGDMMKLISLNENGSLAFENFWLDNLGGNRSSPIAGLIYVRFMTFLKTCSERPIVEEE